MTIESGCRNGEVRQSEDGSKGDYTITLWNRSMAIRSHVKSGKDLEQEKPAVYQEYSDRDSFRDFKRIKIDLLDGS